MTPGLAFFYGGMVRTKHVLVMLKMSFACLGIVTMIWFLFGYSLAFSGDVGGAGLIGNLDQVGMDGVGPDAVTGRIPTLIYSCFMLSFAIITVALISGSIAGRARYAGWLVFTAAWTVLVYIPIAHWVFSPDGWITHDLGALDFAGGTVVELNSGMAGLACALALRSRKDFQRIEERPHSIPLVAIGLGLLWFGWFGFNAGSALQDEGAAAVAAALGVLTGAPPLLAVVTVAVVGPVVGYAFTISPQVGKAARPVAAALVIAQGLGLGPDDALRALAYTAAGAYLQVAFSLGAYAVSRRERRGEGAAAWRKGAIAAELISQLTPGSATFRHAMRLGVALAVGVASYQVLDFGEHGFWVPLTVLFVLAPEAGETFHRLILRAAGTAIGLGVATVVAELVGGNSYALAATLSIATVAIFTTRAIHYAVFSAAITVYAVLLATTLGESALEAVDQRALATALGIAIAMAAFLLWSNPRPEEDTGVTGLIAGKRGG